MVQLVKLLTLDPSLEINFKKKRVKKKEHMKINIHSNICMQVGVYISCM